VIAVTSGTAEDPAGGTAGGTARDTAAGGTRPRVTGDREREVLAAAFEVLREVGYDKLTVDTVAARARASKATLYRRWPTKAALVVEALTAFDGVPDQPDTGSLRGDLLALAEHKRAGLMSPDGADVMCSLSTALHRDGELRAAVLDGPLTDHHACVVAIFQRARDRGEVADGVDLDLVSQVVPALMLFRMSLGPLDEDPADLARRIVDQVVLPAVRRSG
jgi:AcrR family transcriptional regulator